MDSLVEVVSVLEAHIPYVNLEEGLLSVTIKLSYSFFKKRLNGEMFKNGSKHQTSLLCLNSVSISSLDS